MDDSSRGQSVLNYPIFRLTLRSNYLWGFWSVFQLTYSKSVLSIKTHLSVVSYRLITPVISFDSNNFEILFIYLFVLSFFLYFLVLLSRLGDTVFLN